MPRPCELSDKSLQNDLRKALKATGEGVSKPPMKPQAGSVSKVNCTVSFRAGGEAKISLYRHLSPLSVNAILRMLPIDSRVNVQPGMRCLFTSLAVGVEKPRTSYGRGDVALLASGGLICVFLQEVTSDRPLNPLGKVDQGLDLFERTGPGSTIHLTLSKPAATG